MDEITKDRRKEQLKKAQAKFKQIKTNVNTDFFDEIEKRISFLDTNISNYLQTLIKSDLNALKTQNKEKEYLDSINALKSEINDLNAKFKNMGFFEFIIFKIKGKK